MAELPKALKSYIIAHLRRIGYRNIHRAAAFQKAHIGRAQWQCQLCKEIFPSARDLHGDHFPECVIDPYVGFVDWNTYIERLFLGEMQAICKECHKKKSAEENKIRRKVKEDDWENIED